MRHGPSWGYEEKLGNEREQRHFRGLLALCLRCDCAGFIYPNGGTATCHMTATEIGELRDAAKRLEMVLPRGAEK